MLGKSKLSRLQKLRAVAGLLVAWAFVAAPTASAVCEAGEPIAVLSFAGTQRFQEDLELLTELSGAQQLGNQALAWLSRTSGISNLEGMDTTRPLGAVIESDGLVVNPIAFFPVNNTAALLASLSGVVGPTQRGPDGLWKIEHGEFSGFVRERDGWMFFAQDAAALANPPRPEEVLGQLPVEFDAALRMNLQQIPDVFRQFVIDLVRNILRNELTQRPDESAAVHHLRSAWLRFEFDAFERVISESEQVTFGYNLDSIKRRAEFELHFRPLPETSLSRMLKNLREAETRFAELVTRARTGDENSALVAHATLSLGDGEIAATTSHLNELRGPVEELINSTGMIQSEEDRELLARLVGTLFETAEATIDSGRLDMAVLANGESAPVNILAAAHVGGSAGLQQLLERIASSAQEESPWQLKMNFAGISFPAGQTEAVRAPIPVHALEFETENARVLERLFGEDARLYLAMGEDVVWMGIGPESMAGLEQLVRAAEIGANSSAEQAAIAPQAPLAIELRLGEIASVAAQASDNLLWRFWMGSIANGLQAADDTLSFEIAADEQELHARLTMEEGVLRAVAVALSLRLANEEPLEAVH